MLRFLAVIALLLVTPGLTAQETITILDAETGEPIESGTVFFEISQFGIPQSGPDAGEAESISFSDGTATLPPSLEPWTIRIQAPGYLQFSGNLKSIQQTIWLERGIALSVRTIDEAGNPVGGVTVQVRSNVRVSSMNDRIQASGEVSTYRTGSDGVVTVFVADASCGVQAWKSGWAPDARLIQSPGALPDAAVDLVLGAPEFIEARVVDRESSAGLEGATVSISWMSPVNHPHEWVRNYAGRTRTVSGPGGRLRIPAPPEATIRDLKLEHAHAILDSREPGDPMMIFVTHRPVLRGRLISATGDPLPASGQLLQVNQFESIQLSATFSIEEDGSFTIPAFSPPRGVEDDSVGMIQVQGYERLPIEWDSSLAEVSLGTRTLRRDMPLEVFVEDERGNPVAGASVRLSDGYGFKATDIIDHRKTDAQGIAILYGQAHLSRGKIRVQHPMHPDGVAEIRQPTDRLTVSLKSFPVESLGTFQGTIVDQSGSPVAGAQIKPKLEYLAWAPPSPLTRTGPDGSFRFDEFPVSRLEQIAVTKFGYAPLTEELSAEGVPFSLEPLVLHRKLEIEGVVIDARGTPVPRASITVASTETVTRTDRRGETFRATPTQRLITDSEGRFFGRVSWPEVEVHAGARKILRSETQTIELSPERITFVTLEFAEGLEETIDHTIQIVDEEGVPVLGAQLKLSRRAHGPSSLRVTTDAEGFALLSPVPPGALSLQVSCRGYLFKSLDDVAHDELPKVITLSRGAILELALITDEGVELPTSVQVREPTNIGLPTRMLSIVRDGLVTISGCRSGRYPFRLWANDFDTSDEYVASLTEGETTRIEVYLPAEPRPLEFVVRDETGAPIPNALLGVYGGANYDPIVTGEDGIAIFPGTLSYGFHAAVEAPSGYVSRVFEDVMLLERNRRIELTLLRGEALTLQVFESDGSPATQVHCREVFADATGRISLKTVPQGIQHLVIYRVPEGERPSYENGFPRGELLGQVTVDVMRGDSRTIEFRISPLRLISGRVWLDDQPKAGGTIHTPFGEAIVDADGTFQAPFRGYGRFDLEYRDESSLVQEVEIPESGDRSIDLRLQKSALRGRMLDRAGEPIPELTLELRSLGAWGPVKDERRRTKTDNDGRFSFPSQPSGRYLLTVASEDGWFPHGWWITLPQADPIEHVVSRLKTTIDRAGFFSAVIFAADGPVYSQGLREGLPLPATARSPMVVSTMNPISPEEWRLQWSEEVPTKLNETWQLAVPLTLIRAFRRETELTLTPQFETEWPAAGVPHSAGMIAAVPPGGYQVRLRRGDEVRDFFTIAREGEYLRIDVESYFWRGVSPGGSTREE